MTHTAENDAHLREKWRREAFRGGAVTQGRRILALLDALAAAEAESCDTPPGQDQR